MTPSPSTSPPAPAPATKKKRLLLWVALGLGVPLLACLVLGAFGSLMSHRVKTVPLLPSERAALLTADDLLAAGNENGRADPAREKSGRNNLFDGSAELTYEYESETPSMYVATTISLEKTVADAMASYAAQSVAGLVGLAVTQKKMKLEDRDDLLTWGDQSTAKLITYEGKPVGNLFIARKGTRIFLTTVTGVYFDDAEALREIVEPKLKAMDALAR